ncbi:MAG: WYL domain-containing protein [Coriobacteriales bacterium]|nr:WYL domain-containing protein [Coriobacteriales bacterium]
MAHKLADTVHDLILLIQFIQAHAPQDTMLDGDPVMISQLAGYLGVSPSHIITYINTLNYECGDLLPELFIDLDEKNGLITPRRICQTIDKPLRLTAFEAHGLLNALEISGYSQGDLHEKVSGALPALQDDMLQTMVRAAVSPELKHTILMLTTAIRTQQTVMITYLKPGSNDHTHRVIEPYELYFESVNGGWLVRAWCRQSNSWRSFRLDRIESINQQNTPSTHLDQKDNTSPKTALLIIHDPAALDDAYNWRDLHKITQPSRFEETLLNGREMGPQAFIAYIPWYQGSVWLPQMIIRTAGKVEVIAPQSLRDIVCELGQKALATLTSL